MIAAIAGGEQSGLLALMLHRAVASLTGEGRGKGCAGGSAWKWWQEWGWLQGLGCVTGEPSCSQAACYQCVVAFPRPASPAGSEEVPVRYSLGFIEALLSMVGALVTSTSGLAVRGWQYWGGGVTPAGRVLDGTRASHHPTLAPPSTSAASQLLVPLPLMSLLHLAPSSLPSLPSLARRRHRRAVGCKPGAGAAAAAGAPGAVPPGAGGLHRENTGGIHGLQVRLALRRWCIELRWGLGCWLGLVAWDVLPCLWSGWVGLAAGRVSGEKKTAAGVWPGPCGLCALRGRENSPRCSGQAGMLGGQLLHGWLRHMAHNQALRLPATPRLPAPQQGHASCKSCTSSRCPAIHTSPLTPPRASPSLPNSLPPVQPPKQQSVPRAGRPTHHGAGTVLPLY